MIAYRLYGDAQLHWVVLLFNDVKDRYHQWPMAQNQFEKYLLDKYGTTINDVHHYEIEEESGHLHEKIDIGTDNTDYPAASIVTNREFEERRQDDYRRIKLLDPRFIDDFVEEFKRLIKEKVI